MNNICEPINFWIIIFLNSPFRDQFIRVEGFSRQVWVLTISYVYSISPLLKVRAVKSCISYSNYHPKHACAASCLECPSRNIHTILCTSTSMHKYTYTPTRNLTTGQKWWDDLYKSSLHTTTQMPRPRI